MENENPVPISFFKNSGRSGHHVGINLCQHALIQHVQARIGKGVQSKGPLTSDLQPQRRRHSLWPATTAAMAYPTRLQSEPPRQSAHRSLYMMVYKPPKRCLLGVLAHSIPFISRKPYSSKPISPALSETNVIFAPTNEKCPCFVTYAHIGSPTSSTGGSQVKGMHGTQ